VSAVEDDEIWHSAISFGEGHTLTINADILSRLSSYVRFTPACASPHLEWSSSNLLTCATIMSNATTLNPPWGMITSA